MTLSPLFVTLKEIVPAGASATASWQASFVLETAMVPSLAEDEVEEHPASAPTAPSAAADARASFFK